MHKFYDLDKKTTAYINKHIDEIHHLRNELALQRYRVRDIEQDINFIMDRINNSKREIYKMGYKDYA